MPCEFYKFFWKDISSLVVDSLNCGYNNGELSIEQRRGLITLIPKKDKDRAFLKNWRPLTLLNTDYKILAKALANRISPLLDKLIHHNQTGYVKGRYIGENIRTISDLKEYLLAKNKTGILLLIDFEKAFDSVKWKFIQKTLIAFNFGKSFRKWVEVLYQNVQSAVLNNGYITQFFNLERGVRQGCPLSVYLFLLVVELMAIYIRSEEKIKGVELTDHKIVISQLADDTSIFLEGPQYIAPLLSVLKKFAICSGLKTNVEKTKVYNIGNGYIVNHQLQGMKLDNGPIKLLGIAITNNEKENIENNYLPKVKTMRHLLNIWSQRNLSLKGKITVINALIISLFVYPMTITDTPIMILDEIDNAIFSFLWGGKRPKISKSVIQKQIEHGGLKMPNIYLKSKAWKVMWLKRAYLKPENDWVRILDHLLGKVKFIDFMQCNSGDKSKIQRRLPLFYQNILSDFHNISTNNISTNLEIQNQIIWYNHNITIEKSTFLAKVV